MPQKPGRIRAIETFAQKNRRGCGGIPRRFAKGFNRQYTRRALTRCRQKWPSTNNAGAGVDADGRVGHVAMADRRQKPRSCSLTKKLVGQQRVARKQVFWLERHHRCSPSRLFTSGSERGSSLTAARPHGFFTRFPVRPNGTCCIAICDCASNITHRSAFRQAQMAHMVFGEKWNTQHLVPLDKRRSHAIMRQNEQQSAG